MIPRSVAALNKWPYPNAKYQLGTRYHEWVTLLRNLFAIAQEAQAFSLLSNPAVVQNTGAGGNTQMEISNAFDYSIAGVVYSKAATEDIAVSASANTGAAEYKAVTLSIDSAGTVTQTVSDASTSTPVTPPDVPADECAFATIQIPNSFTSGTTTFLTAWVSNGWSAQQTLTASNPATLPETDI